jgi:hypothetical protein
MPTISFFSGCTCHELRKKINLVKMNQKRNKKNTEKSNSQWQNITNTKLQCREKDREMRNT